LTALDSKMRNAIQECAQALADTASGVGADQLGDRTPCEKFTVAELLAHLESALASSVRAAQKEPQPGDAAEAAASPTDVAGTAKRVAAAWGEASAYEGMTQFGPGEMPADFAATITLQELALHGWDLASAAGRPFTVGEEASRTVLSAVETLSGQAGANGGYGPPVTVSSSAPAFHRALAASGRNPEWSVRPQESTA
jgi:uncharacterized protein (TIGR03086 family)